MVDRELRLTVTDVVRHRFGSFGLGVISCLALASCRSAEQREVSREVATIAYAVDRLRDAPSDAKATPLSALNELPCNSSAACELQAVCAQAYSLHVNALALAEQAAEVVRQARATHAADELLRQAERELQHAQAGAHQCVQLEGALVREHRL